MNILDQLKEIFGTDTASAMAMKVTQRTMVNWRKEGMPARAQRMAELLIAEEKAKRASKPTEGGAS
jgi:hypothetical protein